MAKAKIRHTFQSAKADGADTSLVRPSDWNADHEGVEFARKTANESVSSSTLLQDDDHLFFPVAANEVWEWTAFLHVSGGLAAADIKVAFTGPTGSTITWTWLAATDTAGAFMNPLRVGGGVEQAFGVAGGGQMIVLKGLIRNGANAGNLQMQWAQNSASGSTTLDQNSYLIANRGS